MIKRVTETNIQGLLILELDTFIDYRGQYTEVFDEENFKFALYNKYGAFYAQQLTTTFVQDDVIISKKNVLRGFHGDNKTTKLISCLYGDFYAVFIDINPQSTTFRNTVSLTLSPKNNFCVYALPYTVTAHLCTSDECVYYYKQDTHWKGEGNQYTIRWNETEVKPPIHWPIKNPILSERDTHLARPLNDYLIREHLNADKHPLLQSVRTIGIREPNEKF
jgi:dTDP-4-dehydrorhamnose 3,5-epimerase